jgi:phage N-6-adenine-methyltransferase
METATLICPICKRQTCECMLRDREFLARKVGRLMRGEDHSRTTNKGGDGNENDKPVDRGGASTPQWLFDCCNRLAIEACGEPITLDTAAAEWNHKCEWYFTEQDDGLKQDWDARAAWCNPPYSATVIDSFVRKAVDAAEKGTTTFCLLPYWNYPYLDLCEQHGRIHRIRCPVSFTREDGTTTTLNSPHGTSQLVVVAFGPTIQPGFGAPLGKEGEGAGGLAGDGTGSTGTGNGHTGSITARALASGGDRRRANDAYPTPPWAVDSLLVVEKFDGLTWEPAEGDGRIVRALRDAGCEVVGGDLATGTDFLETTKEVDNVVTNPPWGLKTAFIEHAKRCARRKVALLLPLSALSGKARRPLAV